MKIERFLEEDIKKISLLQPKGWPDISPVFGYYLKRHFCNPVKVSIKGETAGVGVGISYGDTGWLAHIIVGKEFRRRGIGGRIVNYLCNHLKEKGHESISLIASELGYPVYKKAGFKEEAEYIFFKREELLKEVAFSKDILRGRDLKVDDILDLDKKISGEDRSRILIEHLDKAYIYQKEGEVLGYYLPTVGEGPIVSDEIEGGIELMKVRASLSDKAVLLVENKEGIAFLKESGFVESNRANRMILGEAFSWSPDKVFNRIGGNFG